MTDYRFRIGLSVKKVFSCSLLLATGFVISSNVFSLPIMAWTLPGLPDPFSESHGEIEEGVNIFSSCKDEMNHEKLYNHGKQLAEGWVYYVLKDSKELAKYPPKTRKDFFSLALVGLQKKYHISSEVPMGICFLGYASAYSASAWSSVHQGFFDYLPVQSRSKFLSLPER